MLGARVVIKRGASEEAEKPFWISFSDLMSALMVMFLVVMSVALLAVTKKVDEKAILEAERNAEIGRIREAIQEASKDFHGVHLEGDNIDLGVIAFYGNGSYQLNPQQAEWLREYIPKILTIASSPEGSRWLRRIVVEGFTSQMGTYLYNLNLSLQRSQGVLCTLLAADSRSSRSLSDPEKGQIRDLFLVGGYSYSLAQGSPEESRKARLRLEFRAVGEKPDVPPQGGKGELGACAI